MNLRKHAAKATAEQTKLYLERDTTSPTQPIEFKFESRGDRFGQLEPEEKGSVSAEDLSNYNRNLRKQANEETEKHKQLFLLRQGSDGIAPTVPEGPDFHTARQQKKTSSQSTASLVLVVVIVTAQLMLPPVLCVLCFVFPAGAQALG